MAAGLDWALANLSAMFDDVPLADLLILLIGLPPLAGAGDWLLAGRKPDVSTRQPLDRRAAHYRLGAHMPAAMRWPSS